MFKTILFIAAAAISQAATVVTDTKVSLGPDPLGPSGGYQLTVIQDPVSTDPTSIFFTTTGQSMTYWDRNLDEGSTWFFANLNDNFNAQTVAAGNFTPFDVIGQSYPVAYGEFYMGVRTSYGTGAPEETRGTPVYGWAKFQLAPGGLTLLGSGISYEVPGILIGTTTVPEPSVVLMAAALPLVLLSHRRRTTFSGTTGPPLAWPAV